MVILKIHSSLLNVLNDSFFTVKSIFPKELIDAWKSMKSKSKTSLDTMGLSGKIFAVVISIPHVFDTLFSIINSSFQAGVVEAL